MLVFSLDSLENVLGDFVLVGYIYVPFMRPGPEWELKFHCPFPYNSDLYFDKALPFSESSLSSYVHNELSRLYPDK